VSADAATITCPKCGTEQPADDACRRCGLIYAKWHGGAGEGEPYAGIAGELWAACEESWDDATRHNAFLLFCRREGSLPYAAGRYRAALQQRGGNDPVATARLAELVKLAEFAAQAEVAKDGARRRSRGPYASAIAFVLGAVALLGAAAAFFYFMKMVR
jgi:hypothetical protein